MPALFDHIDIRVADMEQSKAFYSAILAPLGWSVLDDETDDSGHREVGFGRGDGTSFTLHTPIADPGQDTVTTGAHIAFGAVDVEAVQAFHAAGLAQGGRDIGAPGLRPQYSEGYYGGFLLDPDGNNVEAVCNAS
jgi:catechol 2,3-dioxygenase-like lactoylglutathione lyase family enzyme